MEYNKIFLSISSTHQELKEILERLHAIRQAAKNEQLKYYHPPSHLMSLPELHRHRDANVDRDERRWLSFKGISLSLYYSVKLVSDFEHRRPSTQTTTPSRIQIYL